MSDTGPARCQEPPVAHALAALTAEIRELRGVVDELRGAVRGVPVGVTSTAPDDSPTPPSDEVTAVGDLAAFVIENDIDFIDLGCSNGGSLVHGVKRLGMSRGVGLDIDPRKVSGARASGGLAFVADATKLDVPSGIVRLVQGLHFLEHLPSVQLTASVVTAACHAASEAIYFRQPFFDADAELAELGVKLYWSDWHGHPNRLQVSDYTTMFEAERAAGAIRNFAVFGLGVISGSDDPAVLPSAAPQDQHTYDEGVHGSKGDAQTFAFPVFRETVVIGFKDLQGDLAGTLADSIKGARLLATSMSAEDMMAWMVRP